MNFHTLCLNISFKLQLYSLHFKMNLVFFCLLYLNQILKVLKLKFLNFCCLKNKPQTLILCIYGYMVMFC